MPDPIAYTYTVPVRLSTYLSGLVQGFLGIGSGVMPAPPSGVYVGIMSAEGVEHVAPYSGYARIEATSNGFVSGTIGACHGEVEFTVNDVPGPFGPFTTAKTVHSFGFFDAVSSGNLLFWVPIGTTAQPGDTMQLGKLYMRFRDETAATGKSANSCDFVAGLIGTWVSGASYWDNSLYDQINDITKTCRCMIVESTTNSTGSIWGYPSGGPPDIDSLGSGAVKHATQVLSDVVVDMIPAINGSGNFPCLTMAGDGQTTWQMASSGANGSINKVTYAVVTDQNTSPRGPGTIGSDTNNRFVPIAVWTPQSGEWDYVTSTSKHAWTLGMSLDRTLYQTPNPTYEGSLTGITFETKILADNGYAYEHTLVSTYDSTLGLELDTIYELKTYDDDDSIDGYADPVEVTLYNPDPVYEIVEMRRATVDVRSGDSHVAFSFRLRSADGDTPSIEGKSVVIRYSVNGAATLEVRGSAQADYATSGRVLFALPAAALADPGQVRAELVLQGSGGSTQTYPFDDTIFISIMKSL